MPCGPIPLGFDGALLGLCDSWDSLVLSFGRPGVGRRYLVGNIARMFISSQGSGGTAIGVITLTPALSHQRPLRNS